MKKLLFISFLFITLTYIYYNEVENRTLLCKGENLDDLSYCSAKEFLPAQEQYDIFYNLAISKPESFSSNNQFYVGFVQARNTCVYRKCDLYDQSILEKVMKNCVKKTKNIDDWCTSDYFSKAEPIEENIKIYFNLIGKNKNYTFCPIDNFYNKLSDNVKKELPLNVQQVCNE